MKVQLTPIAGRPSAGLLTRHRSAIWLVVPLLALLLFAVRGVTLADDQKNSRGQLPRAGIRHVQSKLELRKDKPIAVSPIRGWVTLYSPPSVVQHMPASSFCMVHVVKQKDPQGGREEAATILGNCNLGLPGEIFDLRIPSESLATEKVLAVLNEATGSASAPAGPAVPAWVEKEAKLNVATPLTASGITGWVVFHLREGPDVHVPVSAIKYITVVEAVDETNNAVKTLTQFTISAEGGPNGEGSLGFYSPESLSPEKALAIVAAAS